MVFYVYYYRCVRNTQALNSDSANLADVGNVHMQRLKVRLLTPLTYIVTNRVVLAFQWYFTLLSSHLSSDSCQAVLFTVNVCYTLLHGRKLANRGFIPNKTNYRP